MSILSPKFISSNKVFSDKTDEFAHSIMPKPAFIEEVDNNDNNTNFELAFYICVLSARDN